MIFATIITDWIQAICSALGLCINTILIYIGVKQLQQINSQFKTGFISSLLQLEEVIYNRKKILDNIANEVLSINQNESDEKQIKNIERRLNSAAEDYLNSLDRLCYFILRDLLVERGMRWEYQKVIEDVMKVYWSKYGGIHKYNHIWRLYEKWKDEDQRSR